MAGELIQEAAIQLHKAMALINLIYFNINYPMDRLRGLVVRVLGYGSSGPRFDSRRYQIF
jgi:hypothetical protein